ncbi:hypothetical protein [Adoxophyes orana nucleopolyhedrovirus]|uniref:hypothetical protein n=1 Tax=Adoxophyes orana nucleopolyhedrovirus TaxID=542343 RepID=UPI0001829C21|nr:hypothetical protein [Adoxophyes orana nucleopolyhedrovirus]ACF05374.1 hypothetical protein [Adoxophyes orana nucleopolyhedrovirus]
MSLFFGVGSQINYGFFFDRFIVRFLFIALVCIGCFCCTFSEILHCIVFYNYVLRN